MKHLTLTHSTILFEEDLQITHDSKAQTTTLKAQRIYKPLPFLSLFLLFWFFLFLPFQYILGPVSASIVVTLKTVLAALVISAIFYLNKVNLIHHKIPYGSYTLTLNIKEKKIYTHPEGDVIDFAEVERVLISDNVRHHGLRGILYKHTGLKIVGKTFEKTIFRNNFLSHEQLSAVAKTVRETCNI